MTTPIVQSISDEHLEELEQAASEIKSWNLVDAFRHADPDIDDPEDEEWCVGRIDEDGNQYPVMQVNAHQYDSQDSELLAHYYGLCNRDAVIGLIARLRAAEADAKRYRWLAASSWYAGPQPTDEENGYRSNDENWNTGRLSTAIDAAMERTP